MIRLYFNGGQRVMDLLGRCAVIVGTRRIGRAMALRLAAIGMEIGVVYRGSRDEAIALANEVRGLGRRAIAVQSHLSSDAEVAVALDAVEAACGPVSCLVNLASDYQRTPFETLDAEAWDRGMQAARVNYLLAVHASRRIQLQPGPTRGHILQFGDWAAGETPYKDYLPYLTAKAAIQFMTRALAVELARDGILVNTIAPGPTVRPPDISEEEWSAKVVARTPLRRESSVDDIVELAVTLLRSETITGEVIRVDSGRHIAPR
jgi:pteridine reductase